MHTSLNNTRKKRTREELIAAILSGARDGASKTRIMYFSWLSFDQLQKYLQLTLAMNLVRLDNGTKYYITERGLEFLKNFEELQKMEKGVTEKRRVLDGFLQNTAKVQSQT